MYSTVQSGIRFGDAFAVSSSQRWPPSSISKQTPAGQSYSPTKATLCSGGEGFGPGSSPEAGVEGALEGAPTNAHADAVSIAHTSSVFRRAGEERGDMRRVRVYCAAMRSLR